MLKTLPIFYRLFLAFLIIGILPIAILLTQTQKKVKASLKEVTFNTLRAVRESKKQQLITAFNQIDNQIGLLAKSTKIALAITDFQEAFFRVNPKSAENKVLVDWYHNNLSNYFNLASKNNPNITDLIPKSPYALSLQEAFFLNKEIDFFKRSSLYDTKKLASYDQFHSKYHQEFLDLKSKLRFKDLSLVSQDGFIIYSIEKEITFATNLNTGPYNNTPLSRCYKEALKNEFSSTTFKPFVASFYEPTAFYCQKITRQNEVLGVLILQISKNIFNLAINNSHNWVNEQLGLSGEAFVVGEDYFMLSDSRFTAENNLRLKQLLKNNEINLEQTNPVYIKSASAQAAIRGEIGFMSLFSYHERKVLSAYSSLNIHNNRFAILVEMEEAEVLSPLAKLQDSINSSLLLLAIFILLLSLYLSHSLTKPIFILNQAINYFANTQIIKEVPLIRHDELGNLTKNFNQMQKSIIEQILEKTIAEQKSSQSEHLLKTVLQQMPIAIYFEIKKTKTTSQNLAFNLLLEKVPHLMEEILKLEQKIYQEQKNILEERIELKDQNKRIIYLDVSILNLNDLNKDNLGYLVCLEDVSESINRELNMLKHQKLESLGNLAGGIAHDFNNFLTGICGNIELSLLELDENSPLVKRLNNALNAGFRASELTQQLLTFSKGGSPIRKQVDLVSLCHEASKLTLSGSNVILDIQSFSDKAYIYADKIQIEQVISNLILNAKQAMLNGGTLKIEILNEENYVIVKVSDQGLGISEENIKKIFDPYFTTKGSGTGLGLATTYSIINKHNGYIEVESILGSGTTFIVYLPSYKVELNKQETKELPTQNTKTQIIKNSPLVLIMDDEKDIRLAIEHYLTFMGFKCISATNGEDLLKIYKNCLLENKLPLATILDLTVPGANMGGKEAASQILKLDPKAYLIVISGYSDNEVLSNFKKYGFKKAIQKPKILEPLFNSLKEVYNERTKTT